MRVGVLDSVVVVCARWDGPAHGRSALGGRRVLLTLIPLVTVVVLAVVAAVTNVATPLARPGWLQWLTSGGRSWLVGDRWVGASRWGA